LLQAHDQSLGMLGLSLGRAMLPCSSLKHATWLRRVVTEQASAQMAVNEVFALFEKYGANAYVGEHISQAEHSLQAADLARKAGFDRNAVIAALLHGFAHSWHDMSMRNGTSVASNRSIMLS